jgi:hypothetical protein
MAKGKHESDKNQRSAYKNEGRHETNRLAKLETQLKRQPKNAALAERIRELKKTGVPYRRNRRATLPGSILKLRPKVKITDSKKQEAWERKQPKVEAPYMKMLRALYNSLRPKIRVKRAKRPRIPQTN